MREPTWWANGALGIPGGRWPGPYHKIIDCPIDLPREKTCTAHAVGPADNELTIPAKAYLRGKTLFGSIYMTTEGPRFSPKNTK